MLKSITKFEPPYQPYVNKAGWIVQLHNLDFPVPCKFFLTGYSALQVDNVNVLEEKYYERKTMIFSALLQ